MLCSIAATVARSHPAAAAETGSRGDQAEQASAEACVRVDVAGVTDVERLLQRVLDLGGEGKFISATNIGSTSAASVPHFSLLRRRRVSRGAASVVLTGKPIARTVSQPRP
jgi:hypothetical protein